MDSKVFFNIGYGLYLLTSNKDNKDNGCIINTVTQVASSPCMISISLSKANYTTEIIRNNKKFNISILTEKVPFDIFKRFGYQSGKDVNKFDNFYDFSRSNNEITYLTKYSNSYISAYVKEEIDLGSHILFIAAIVDAQSLNNDKSVTYNYYQENIKPKPENSHKKGWRCKICNYIYEGENIPADFICPICKHGIADFEKIQ